MKEMQPLSMRLESKIRKRLEKCCEKTGIPQRMLAQSAIEAVIEAIEENDYKVVMPITLQVGYIPKASIIKSPSRKIDIPLYGYIAAGYPNLTEQVPDQHISVDIAHLPVSPNEKLFILQVDGSSMIGANIHDKDKVILAVRTPKNRDIVAALIDGQCTLKKFIKEGEKNYLKAENPKYPNLIPAEELVIQGVVVGKI